MNFRKFAGMLLIVSSVTHVMQLFVYSLAVHTIGAAVFGIIYFIVGLLLLLRTKPLVFWLGAILPTIGGILGIYRFFFLHPNSFTIFHLAIDAVVVPICIDYLRKKLP